MNTGTAQNTSVPGLNLQQGASQGSAPQPASQPTFTPPAKKSPFNIKMIIGIIILVLTIVGVAAAYFLSQQSQDVRQQASVGSGSNCSSRTSEGICKLAGCDWDDGSRTCKAKLGSTTPSGPGPGGSTPKPIGPAPATPRPAAPGGGAAPTQAPTPRPPLVQTPTPIGPPTAAPNPGAPAPAPTIQPCSTMGQTKCKDNANRCNWNGTVCRSGAQQPAPAPTTTPPGTPGTGGGAIPTPAPCASLSPSQCPTSRCSLAGVPPRCQEKSSPTSPGPGGVPTPTPASGPTLPAPTPGTPGGGAVVNCSSLGELACKTVYAEPCDWVQSSTVNGFEAQYQCVNAGSSAGPGPGGAAGTPPPSGPGGGAVSTPPPSGPGGVATPCNQLNPSQCQAASDRCSFSLPDGCENKSAPTGPGPGGAVTPPGPVGPGAGGGGLSPICVEHTNAGQEVCNSVDGCEWEGGFCQVEDEGASLGNPGSCPSGISICYRCPGQLNPAGGCQLNPQEIIGTPGSTVQNAGVRGSLVDYCGIVQCDCKGTSQSGSGLVFTSQVFTSQCSNLPTKYACVNGTCQATTGGTGYTDMEMCQMNCGQSTPPPSVPPGQTPPPPTVPPVTYQCNSRCNTDAQCQTSDNRFRCVDTNDGRRCRLNSNPNSSQCRPATGPQCLSITMSNVTRPESPVNTEPNVGEAVRFTCGTVAAAERYVFRIFGPSGEPITLQSTGNVSAPFNILTTGPYSAQCQICTGQDDSTCLPFEAP